METSDNTEALQPTGTRQRQRFWLHNIALGLAAAALLGVLCVYELDRLQDKSAPHFVPAGGPTAETVDMNSPIDDGSASPDFYHGVDISHYQTDFESEITPEDGLTFAICKATQGTDFVDPDFENNWRMAQNKGLVKGCYHFFIYGQDPVAQAKFYVATVGSWGAKDIAPIIDLEPAGIPGSSPSPADYQTDVKTFLNTVEKACHCTPMIYSGKYFVNQYLNDPYFAQYPLWFAEYTTAEVPALPNIWEKAGYKIWQKSDEQDINSTTVDFDVYYGPKAGLWEK